MSDKRIFIPILDDGLITNPSPLTILDTAYYETWYKPTTTQTWLQQVDISPLPVKMFASPGVVEPYIILSPLPGSTNYQYQIRRFDSDGNFSQWVTGNFTT